MPAEMACPPRRPPFARAGKPLQLTMFYQLEATPAREVIPSFRAKMLHSANMTFAFWDVAAGGILPEHHHPHEQVAILLEGHFEMN